MDNKRICPCCEQHYFKEPDFYEVCPICKWRDDLLQRTKPDAKGANILTLNQHKAQWGDKQLVQEISQHEKSCGTQLSTETIRLLEKIKNRLSENELRKIPQ